MISVFSWQNFVSLYPASFCTPLPNLHVIPGISWVPTFAFQSPMIERTSFFMLVLEGLAGLHRTGQLQLLQHLWLGHMFGLLWYWMVGLGNNQDHSVICETAPKDSILDSFVHYNGYSISSKGFLPAVVDIKVIWVKFTHSVLFHWFLKRRHSLLTFPVWPLLIYLDSWT